MSESLIEKKPEENTIEKSKKQSKEQTDIVARIRDKFTAYSNVRNNTFSHFGLGTDGQGRDLIQAIDYSNKLVDNYRVKPSFKEEWQANISDITLHSKLMAVLANVIGQKYIVEYHPRFTTDRESRFMSNVLDDTASYIYTQERNGHIDQLFSALKALREPACIKYVGYKDTSYFKGLDIQFVKLDEFYPERINTFFMHEIHRCIWRRVWNYQAWKDDRLNNSSFVDTNKVMSAGSIRSDSTTFFDVSVDLKENQVEELLWFDEINNEFHIVANDILITKPGTTLKSVSQSGKIPFTKTGFEPFGADFFYYRSLAMVMGPTQEAIDYMFNAMFDKVMLDVMRPILVGGINELVDDYIGPGVYTEVADVNQIKELDVRPLDLTAFRVLKELQDRNTFASVDAASQGKVSLGSPTATEVERVQEAAQKMFGMFNLMLTDGLKQEYDLVGDIIIGKYFKNPDFKEFFVENAKLMGNRIGTKIFRIKPSGQLPPRDQLGTSVQLQQEAMTKYEGEVEITEFDPKIYKDYKYKVVARPAPAIENSKWLKKAMLNQKLVQMYAQPQLYNPQIVKKIDVENNKDILGEFSDELLQAEGQPPTTPEGLPMPLSAGQTSNQMMPQNQKSTPDLTKLLTSPTI